MNPPRLALVTPTYRNDYEVCRILVDSVAKHVPPHIHHYLFVERRDEAMFRPLCNERTHLRIVNDFIPWWLFRIPGVPGFWMSLKTLPVRNWIMQQIIKLSIAGSIEEDAFYLVDSDIFFARPFNPDDTVRDGRVPLMVETGQAGLIANNDNWHNIACRLLKLPEKPVHDTNFVGPMICWRRDHALELQRYLSECNGGRELVSIMSEHLWFSEFILYGLFVTEVLKERSGHWIDDSYHTLCHWGENPLDAAGLADLKRGGQPDQFAVMINAKSHTPSALIRDAFDLPLRR